MKYKNITNTDLLPSEICLGSELFGSLVNTQTSYKIMDMFLDSGGNFIDTAHAYADCYSNEKSISEKTIGKWMKERKNRNKLIIGSKGGYPYFRTMNIPRLSKEEVKQDLDESLLFLQTDYIDLYWLHRDDPNRPVEEIIDYLNEFVKKGKIRYFGCSNWTADRIIKAVNYSKEKNIKSFVANQMMWSLGVPNIDAIEDKTLISMDDELKNLHLELNLTAIPYFAQAKGFFAKMSNGQKHMLNNMAKSVFYTNENLKRLERCEILSKEINRPVSAIVLGYLMSQSFTTIPIVGCRKIEYLTDALSAMDLAFKSDIIAYLERG